MSKFCKYCGKEFEPTTNPQIFCSSQCRANEWYHRNTATRPKKHICEECGNIFWHKYDCTKFCSTKCRQKYNRHKNINKYREQRKDYYWKNRNRIRERSKQYENKYHIKRVQKGYTCWNAIKQRCNNHNNKSYKYYGAQGIQCMLTFDEFHQIYFRTQYCEECGCKLSDVYRKSGTNSRTIDRINSNKHYDKDNIRVICRSCNSRKMNNERKSKIRTLPSTF